MLLFRHTGYTIGVKGTQSGEATAILIVPVMYKGGLLLKERICSFWEQILSIKSGSPFGMASPGKQTGRKNCSPA